MPEYALICRNDECDHKWTQFASMRERGEILCPLCQCKNPYTDFQRQGTPKTQHTWEGQESKSMALAFDPDGIAELKKEVPDIELDKDGHVVFRNDKHQRDVYRQIEQAKNDELERQQERLGRKPRAEEIQEAAQAIDAFEQERTA